MTGTTKAAAIQIVAALVVNGLLVRQMKAARARWTTPRQSRTASSARLNAG